MQLWSRVKELLQINPFKTAAYSLSDYLSEFGVTLRSTESRNNCCDSAYWESDYIGILMVSELDEMTTMIKPSPLSTPSTQGVATLGDVLDVIHPEVEFEELRCGSFRQTQAVMKRNLDFIKQYCFPLLEGDFSSWRDIKKLVE